MSTNKTSNKWLNVLRILVLPIATIICLYLFASVLLEVFGISIPGFVLILKPILNANGISDVFHLGNMFWIVVGKIFYLGALFFSALFATIGLNRKSSSGSNHWIFHLFLGLIGLLSEQVRYILPNMKFLNIFANTDKEVMQNLLYKYLLLEGTQANYALIIFFGILTLLMAIFLFCNVVYFSSRKNTDQQIETKPQPTTAVEEQKEVEVKEEVPNNEEEVKKEVWICPRCKFESTGNYCDVCGSPKPSESAIQEAIYNEDHSQYMPNADEIDLALNDLEASFAHIGEREVVHNSEVNEDMLKEDIKLELPEEKPKEKVESTIVLEEGPKKEKLNDEISLEVPEKHINTSEEITDMQVDVNPFAVKVDKNIDLVIEPKADNTLSRFCPNCGKPIEIGDKFCTNCGNKLED